MSRHLPRIFLAHLLAGCLVASSGDSLAQGRTARAFAEHLDSATAHYKAGRFRKALDDYKAALERAESEGDAAGRAQALFGAGITDLAMGRNPRGADRLARAATLATEIGDESLVLRSKVALGSALLQAGKRQEAKTMIDSALRRARAAGMQEQAAMAAAELGRLLASGGQSQEAVAAYRESLEDAVAAGARTLAAKSAVNLARALLDGEQESSGWAALTEARARVDALPPSHDRAYALISMGRLYARVASGQPAHGREARERSRETLQSAADTARAVGDVPALSYALGFLGQLDEAQRVRQGGYIAHGSRRIGG